MTPRAETHSGEQSHDALEVRDQRREVRLDAVAQQPQTATAAKAMPALGLPELPLSLTALRPGSLVLGCVLDTLPGGAVVAVGRGALVIQAQGRMLARLPQPVV